MMATVPHVISELGLRKFQADGFLLTRVYVKLEDFRNINVAISVNERVNEMYFKLKHGALGQKRNDPIQLLPA